MVVLFCISRKEPLIDSLASALEAVRDFESTKRNFIRFNARSRGLVECFYRGQANASWWMTPGVFRDGHLPFEARYYQEMVRRNPEEFIHLSRFDQLQKMQHYELPTRLLDITRNPLVALYFACQSELDEDKNECDGKLLMFLSDKLHSEDERIQAIMWLMTKADSFEAGEIEAELGISLSKFFEYLDDDYVVMPSMNNERIIRQSGAFIIFGNRITNQVEFDGLPMEYDFSECDNANKTDEVTKNVHSLIGFTDVLLGADQAAFAQYLNCFEYRVSGRSKAMILNELHGIDITKERLFPSLANSAHEVVEQYREVRTWLRERV